MAGETTTQITANAPLYTPDGNEVANVRKKFEITTAELEADDLIDLVTIPKDCTVLDGYVYVDDLDAHACPTITIEIGNSADEDGYLANSTAAQAGGLARFDGVLLRDGVALTADTTVTLKIEDAAATAAAGTVTLVMFYARND